MQFELITESNRPVAAIIPHDARGLQFRTIYRLLPDNCYSIASLAERWGVHAVLCNTAFAKEQFNRVPCTKPKDTIKLTLHS